MIKQTVKPIYFALNQVYYTLFGHKVVCNICGLKRDKLKSDAWHLYSQCPRCYAYVRQRLLWAMLCTHKKFNADVLLRHKKVLHFAPENNLRSKIKALAATYTTADYLTEGYAYDAIDLITDISNMPEIDDNSYDTVIACDVLEHVPLHLEAMREVYRILKPQGYCIFTVPQKDNLQTTFEDNTITDPQERARVFGQFDHVRIYGNDFKDMLAAANFEVSIVDENDFDAVQAQKNVLFPPVLSDNPLATNYRKIFIGYKK